MRFEYLISKTRGEGEGMAGSPERGEEGSSGPPVPLWLLSRVLRAGGWGNTGASISTGGLLPSGHCGEGPRASRKTQGLGLGRRWWCDPLVAPQNSAVPGHWLSVPTPTQGPSRLT